MSGFKKINLSIKFKPGNPIVLHYNDLLLKYQNKFLFLVVVVDQQVNGEQSY